MSAAAPLVSVITATYNWSSVLRYAIQSVLWQTFTDYEYLVVGDACTDDSGEVVASFNDPRVRWHNLEVNSGNQFGPNNAGIAMARGKYIAYLGHDDLWYPTHLEHLVRLAEETGADIVHSWLAVIGAPETGQRSIRGVRDPDNPAVAPFVPPSGFMHRRTLTDEIGPWRSPRVLFDGPDYDLWNRAVAAGKRIVGIDELTVFKFPSAARKNSYVEKPFHEQATYARRMREEPDFIERELKALLAAQVLGKHDRAIAGESLLRRRSLRPGQLNRWRQERRGLPPPELPPLTPAIAWRMARRYVSYKLPRRLRVVGKLRRALRR